MAKTPSPWEKQQSQEQYELKDYNDLKRLLTLTFERGDKKAEETALTRLDLLEMGILDRNDKYRTWAHRLLERFPEKTWDIEFTGRFKRLGRTEEEAREEADRFLQGLILVNDVKISKIAEEGVLPKKYQL
jgi:hypothetical protein